MSFALQNDCSLDIISSAKNKMLNYKEKLTPEEANTFTKGCQFETSFKLTGTMRHLLPCGEPQKMHEMTIPFHGYFVPWSRVERNGHYYEENDFCGGR